ncbi:MAG TPA: 30S ribosomal protein S6 [bacterium]|nr:30S ribosomal protein S6 [bacterium]HPL95670.1 30S ribosomal protein S6 [bacterium]
MSKNNQHNLFVLLPNFTEEQTEQIILELQELIKKHGGEITAEEKLGKRKLSYPVKKMRHGAYLNYVLESSKLNWPALQKDLRLKPDVLRFELSRFVVRGDEVKNVINYDEDKNGDKFSVAQEVLTPAVDNIKEEIREKIKKENKISLEELDQKLDDLLEDNNV